MKKPLWQQQQEQMRRQQDQQRQQMGWAWQQQQKKKARARKTQAELSNLSRLSGGSIQAGQDVVGGDKINAGRDYVGRDKVEQHDHLYVAQSDQDEKPGCLLFLERAFAFVMALAIGGLLFGLFGALIGSAILGEGGSSLGVFAGVVLALVFAVATANNVSRYRL